MHFRPTITLLSLLISVSHNPVSSLVSHPLNKRVDLKNPCYLGHVVQILKHLVCSQKNPEINKKFIDNIKCALNVDDGSSTASSFGATNTTLDKIVTPDSSERTNNSEETVRESDTDESTSGTTSTYIVDGSVSDDTTNFKATDENGPRSISYETPKVFRSSEYPYNFTDSDEPTTHKVNTMKSESLEIVTSKTVPYNLMDSSKKTKNITAVKINESWKEGVEVYNNPTTEMINSTERSMIDRNTSKSEGLTEDITITALITRRKHKVKTKTMQEIKRRLTYDHNGTSEAAKDESSTTRTNTRNKYNMSPVAKRKITNSEKSPTHDGRYEGIGEIIPKEGRQKKTKTMKHKCDLRPTIKPQETSFEGKRKTSEAAKERSSTTRTNTSTKYNMSPVTKRKITNSKESPTHEGRYEGIEEIIPKERRQKETKTMEYKCDSRPTIKPQETRFEGKRGTNSSEETTTIEDSAYTSCEMRKGEVLSTKKINECNTLYSEQSATNDHLMDHNIIKDSVAGSGTKNQDSGERSTWGYSDAERKEDSIFAEEFSCNPRSETRGYITGYRERTYNSSPSEEKLMNNYGTLGGRKNIALSNCPCSHGMRKQVLSENDESNGWNYVGSHEGTQESTWAGELDAVGSDYIISYEETADGFTPNNEILMNCCYCSTRRGISATAPILLKVPSVEVMYYVIVS